MVSAQPSLPQVVYRYDLPHIMPLLLGGSIRVSTLDACRRAENPQAADPGEGSKVVTSLPGIDYPDGVSFAKLLGVDPSAIFVGPNAVRLEGGNAVRRQEHVEAYVLCTSAVNSTEMRRRFGSGCVEILDPLSFFRAVDEALRTRLAPRTLSHCYVDFVEYNRRENNYRDHTSKHPVFLKPSGPPRHFEVESEIRAVWLPQGGFTPQPEILLVPAACGLLRSFDPGFDDGIAES